MNIAIEARALSNKGSGIRTYTQQLITHLAGLHDADVNLHVIYDSPVVLGSFPQTQEHVVPLGHPYAVSWWLNHSIPPALERLHPDIVHFTKAAIPPRKVARTIVTIYDTIPLIYPGSQSFLRRWYWPRTLYHAAQASDQIITISEASKHDIVRLLHVPEEKVDVIPLAVDISYFRPITDSARLSAVQEKYHIEGPYILFVATRDPRKNVAGLIRAFSHIAAHIPHQLVIAGKPGVMPDNAEDVAKQMHMGDRVRCIDFVDYEDLPALYSAADLFVWPSIYEGWAFPVLEAMACGTPVIVSNGGALPEVVGQAGLTIPFSTDNVEARLHDSQFEEKLGKAIASTLANTASSDIMRAAGLAQAASFSWHKVAEETLQVYKKVCAR
jgi:glycosyltransferase involved in cell wall biosynthesis